MPLALAAVRARLLGVTDRLTAEDWQSASRCEQWSVHHVLRHVRDACRLHARQLRSPGISILAPGFDARRTPQEWLEPSEGEAPETTAADLRLLVTDEEAVLGARIEGFRDETVMGPYGPAHWTVLTTHVFWDAWLHLRDVTAALGWPDAPTPVEEEVVTLYALLIASMPAALHGHSFTATVDLIGSDARHHLAQVAPGRVSLRSGDAPTGDEQLHGDVAPVVDALAGRGPPVPSVLRGDPAALEPLTWLSPILAPAP